MGNYEKLIEMDTDNDSNVQLQLYKECLAGAGEGKKEAMEWLKLSAENGNEEAIGILDSINNESNISDDDKYSKMSMLELLQIHNSDYHATKELYYNRSQDVSFENKLEMLSQLCSFEVADYRDYESLAEMYYFDIYSSLYKKNYIIAELCNKTIEACENAIELGSHKAKKYLASVFMFQHPNDRKTFEVCNQAAIENDIYNKFLHYVAIKFKILNAPNPMYMTAWEEELEKDTEFINSKVGHFYNLIKTLDTNEIIGYESDIFSEVYNEDEMIVLSIAFKMITPNCKEFTNYRNNQKCLNYVYYLYLLHG